MSGFRCATVDRGMGLVYHVFTEHLYLIQNVQRLTDAHESRRLQK